MEGHRWSLLSVSISSGEVKLPCNLFIWQLPLFSFKCFTASWGEIPRVFQREVSATLLAEWRSDGLKMRGNCPGVWPLSPVWSAFHSDQWEGTVPGTGGWGQCHPPDKHHREQLTGSFQTTSIWRKPDSATWLLCLNPQPSLLLSETEHERVPPWNQEPGKPSALPTFVSLSSRMPRAPNWVLTFRFPKGEPLVPDWTGRSL